MNLVDNLHFKFSMIHNRYSDEERQRQSGPEFLVTGNFNIGWRFKNLWGRGQREQSRVCESPFSVSLNLFLYFFICCFSWWVYFHLNIFILGNKLLRVEPYDSLVGSIKTLLDYLDYSSALFPRIFRLLAPVCYKYGLVLGSAFLGGGGGGDGNKVPV